MARPTLCTPEISGELLRRFAAGETIKAICEDEHMPHRSSVYYWIAAEGEEFAEFQKAYGPAQVAHALALADDCLDIADNTDHDTRTISRSDGSEYDVANTEYIQRSKLRVETRMKLMAKRAPALFGESLQLGGMGGGAIKTEEVGERDLGRRLAFTLVKGLLGAKQAKQIEHVDTE